VNAINVWNSAFGCTSNLLNTQTRRFLILLSNFANVILTICPVPWPLPPNAVDVRQYILISYLAFSEGSNNRWSNEAWDCRNSVCNSHQRPYTHVYRVTESSQQFIMQLSLFATEAVEEKRTVSGKKVSLCFCLHLCQILTDFQNSFTDRLTGVGVPPSSA